MRECSRKATMLKTMYVASMYPVGKRCFKMLRASTRGFDWPTAGSRFQGFAGIDARWKFDKMHIDKHVIGEINT